MKFEAIWWKFCQLSTNSHFPPSHSLTPRQHTFLKPLFLKLSADLTLWESSVIHWLQVETNVFLEFKVDIFQEHTCVELSPLFELVFASFCISVLCSIGRLLWLFIERRSRILATFTAVSYFAWNASDWDL